MSSFFKSKRSVEPLSAAAALEKKRIPLKKNEVNDLWSDGLDETFKQIEVAPDWLQSRELIDVGFPPTIMNMMRKDADGRVSRAELVTTLVKKTEVKKAGLRNKLLRQSISMTAKVLEKRRQCEVERLTNAAARLAEEKETLSWEKELLKSDAAKLGAEKETLNSQKLQLLVAARRLSTEKYMLGAEKEKLSKEKDTLTNEKEVLLADALRLCTEKERLIDEARQKNDAGLLLNLDPDGDDDEVKSPATLNLQRALLLNSNSRRSSSTESDVERLKATEDMMSAVYDDDDDDESEEEVNEVSPSSSTATAHHEALAASSSDNDDDGGDTARKVSVGAEGCLSREEEDYSTTGLPRSSSSLRLSAVGTPTVTPSPRDRKKKIFVEIERAPNSSDEEQEGIVTPSSEEDLFFAWKTTITELSSPLTPEEEEDSTNEMMESGCGAVNVRGGCGGFATDFDFHSTAQRTRYKQNAPVDFAQDSSHSPSTYEDFLRA